MTSKPGMGPGTTPGPSGRRVEDRHQGRTGDLERARKTTPQSLRDVPDVTANEGPVYAGQSVHYNADTGLYEHQSRIERFSQHPPGVIVVAAETDHLDIPYGSCLRHLHVRVTAAPSSAACVVQVKLNGTVEATATVGIGTTTADAGVNDPVGIPLDPDADVLTVHISDSDAVGLTGYLLL